MRSLTSVRALITALAMMAVAQLLGCDQTVSEPPDSGVKTVEVVYGEQAPVVVDLADLALFERDGEEYARLSDVVEAADLGVALESLEFDFEASDGFRSSSTSTCVDTIPMAGELLRQGYVHRVTRNLDWDVEPELPGCVGRMRDVTQILASDGDDVPRLSVEVLFDDDVWPIFLDDAEVVDFEGSEAVGLADVVELSGIDVAVERLVFDFIAADGFRASSSSNCVDLFPLTGDQIAQGYILLSNRNLVWDEAADLPGCAFVDDLAQIEATRAAVGPFVDVTYGEESVTVDLGWAQVENVGGVDTVAVAEVVEMADLGLIVADLELDFVGSDGFRPSTNATCNVFFPIAGSEIDLAHIELETRNLIWDAEAGLPGCAYVDDIAQIVVSD